MRRCPDCHGELRFTQEYCPYCSCDLFKKQNNHQPVDSWKAFNQLLDAVIH